MDEVISFRRAFWGLNKAGLSHLNLRRKNAGQQQRALSMEVAQRFERPSCALAKKHLTEVGQLGQLKEETAAAAAGIIVTGAAQQQRSGGSIELSGPQQRWSADAHWANLCYDLFSLQK